MWQPNPRLRDPDAKDAKPAGFISEPEYGVPDKISEPQHEVPGVTLRPDKWDFLKGVFK